MNSTASGGTLQKTGGCSGCPDAGAISEQQIASGDGSLQFTAPDGKLQYIGLSVGNNGTGAAEIKFALRFQGGVAEVREAGAYKSEIAFSGGDIFRVGVEGGTVKYWKNGAVFYTSSSQPAYPLNADTSLYDMNATVGNATVSGPGGAPNTPAPSPSPSPSPAPGTPVTEPVRWTSLVNVAANGGTLQKTGGCGGCPDAGAVSEQQITSGDGSVEFTASEANTLRFVGLSVGNSGTGAAEIRFALRLQGGVAEVREAGAYKADVRFAAGDVFRIAVEGGTVKYVKNGAVFLTSGSRAELPLLVDTSLYDAGAAINNAIITR